MQARRAQGQVYSSDVIELGGALALEAIELAHKTKRPVEADAIEAAAGALIGLPLIVLTPGDWVSSLAALADGRLASGRSEERRVFRRVVRFVLLFVLFAASTSRSARCQCSSCLPSG